ncbi:MAG: nicotinate-nucleotide--dimethylbenzimidazole phosphoribosyltransferase [Deltaproteobacteria bacterium]|nr:nicotinate-nucleotide--dimethylbenzimidazole phosphoribosyltransferase [Deltaproteobacteria bacterium]
MWSQGHRDLVLPRIPGHEIAGYDDRSGLLYTVWPGQSCGKCRYCTDGRENLCEEMRIIGFHSDGGFSRWISVPTSCLVPVSEKIDPRILTFAEPAACILNALSRFPPRKNEKIIIYGGGVLGITAALICREMKLAVTVVEQSQEKISRLHHLCHHQGIELCKNTTEADYDLAINCCDSPIAFSLCITKLRKGGRFAYFSGVKKNEVIETTLLNLIHYKELELYGAYGPRKEHMVQALPFCARQQKNLSILIEKTLQPQDVELVLPHILSGNALKYIIDFTGTEKPIQPVLSSKTNVPADLKKNSALLSPLLSKLIREIKPLDQTIRDRAQKKVDLKTKPLGALGRIEELAVQLSTIKKDLNPKVECRRMFVFAGDHGVVEEGVSAFPSRVTVQMVENFLNGGAAINGFCHQYDIELSIIDMGVNGNFDNHPQLINKKVAYGTRNFAVQKAMTSEEAIQSIENGARAFLEKNKTGRCDLIGVGEMGIGNSSSATAIISGASGLAPSQVAGRGTGVDDKGLEHKTEVIARALALHQPERKNGLDLLSKVGGYELGGICGAVLAAASEDCCVVLDGIISTAAGLLACLICPDVKNYLIAGHKSVETGQRAALDIMGLEPVIDLDLRLGEGTGAAITMNLVDLACRMMREMASFDDAGVDGKTL